MMQIFGKTKCFSQSGSRQNAFARRFGAFMGAVILTVSCAGCGDRNPTGGTTEEAAKTPVVENAEDAIRLMQSRGKRLGYDNALSELTQKHSATVGGDSYYRLQQNYRGIPVFGRDVIYVTDDRGQELTVIENVRDIPEDLNLEPSVSPELAEQEIRSYMAANFPQQEVPQVLLDMESLFIYDREEPARLVFPGHVPDRYLLIDAHTGQVVFSKVTTVEDTATFYASGAEVDVDRREDGTYVLKDEKTQTYMYSANQNTYIEVGQNVDYSALTLVTSEDAVFGSGEDSVSPESMVTAEKMLERVNDIRAFFDRLQPEIVEKLVLIYDDQMGTANGENGVATYEKVGGLIGTALYDGSWQGKLEKVGRISIGSVYSADPVQYADLIAHEYTHVVSFKLVDWDCSSYENRALNEAYSDIFGELYEGYMRGGEPDWLHCVKLRDLSVGDAGYVTGPPAVDYITRNLIDPTDTETYPLRGDRTYPDHLHEEYSREKPHTGSVIISQIACQMAMGTTNVPDSAIPLEDLAQLWFKSMLMLPSDADFEDCHRAVLEAAEQMDLTKAQRTGIAQAFYQAGFFCEVSGPLYIRVFDADGERFTEYDLTVRQPNGLLPQEKTYSPEGKEASSFKLELPGGDYELIVTNRIHPSQTLTVCIHVEEQLWGKGSTTVPIFAGFTQVQPEEPTEPSLEELPAAGVAFHIERIDRSRVESGESTENYYMDYVVLEGDSPAIRKINTVLYEDAQRFTSGSVSGDVLASYGPGMSGYCVANSRVMYNQNGVLCVTVMTDEYTGGNTNHVNAYSFCFNVQTGDTASLTDLTGMDEATLLPLIQQIAWDQLHTRYGNMLFGGVEDLIKRMELKDFRYELDDGQIWLLFEPYTVAPGAVGNVTIPTGLYLGGGSQ